MKKRSVLIKKLDSMEQTAMFLSTVWLYATEHPIAGTVCLVTFVLFVNMSMKFDKD